jgi:hypothetical protein
MVGRGVTHSVGGMLSVAANSNAYNQQEPNGAQSDPEPKEVARRRHGGAEISKWTRSCLKLVKAGAYAAYVRVVVGVKCHRLLILCIVVGEFSEELVEDEASDSRVLALCWLD